MYLLVKLKPFEQKEHFSLKEQNGLGWNLAYVRKGLDGQGIEPMTSRLDVGRSYPLTHQSPSNWTLQLTDLYVWH